MTSTVPNGIRNVSRTAFRTLPNTKTTTKPRPIHSKPTVHTEDLGLGNGNTRTLLLESAVQGAARSREAVRL